MGIVLAVVFSALAFAAGFALARRPAIASAALAAVRAAVRAARDRVLRVVARAWSGTVGDSVTARFGASASSSGEPSSGEPPSGEPPYGEPSSSASPFGASPFGASPFGASSSGASGSVGTSSSGASSSGASSSGTSASGEPAVGAPLVAASGSAAAALTRVRFHPIAERGTASAALDLHAPAWRAAMGAVGDRLDAAAVTAIVFVHGTFTGTDPLSAYGVVERALPGSLGPSVARALRRTTRGCIERVLGDLGNFGAAYARLFEEAIRPRGARIPCTEFVWSSENHHVGRLEGALGLLRVLATHAEIGDRAPRRLLVLGHSHAGQLFALVTQLLARSLATEAILDVARARGLDVAALEADIDTLTGASGWIDRGRETGLDFVTFGAPNRYAWATVPGVRSLHVLALPPGSPRGEPADGDWIRRLGVEGSDFPALGARDRRLNASLSGALGHAGLSPVRLAAALYAGAAPPSHGEVVFVDYGDRRLLSTGLGHGTYTRLDAMLFHARLVADRLYPSAAEVTPPELAARDGRGAGGARPRRA